MACARLVAAAASSVGEVRNDGSCVGRWDSGGADSICGVKDSIWHGVCGEHGCAKVDAELPSDAMHAYGGMGLLEVRSACSSCSDVGSVCVECSGCSSLHEGGLSHEAVGMAGQHGMAKHQQHDSSQMHARGRGLGSAAWQLHLIVRQVRVA